MAAKRKIVFVIVEGISDQTALAVILGKLIQTEEVIVEITRGDLTTEFGVTGGDIAAKVGNIIKEYSRTYSYKQADYLEVVHIIDTDGAFIGGDKVIYDPSERIHYELDCIRTENCEGTKSRNRQKSANVRRLIPLPKVWVSVPYSIYFFSCNLDHVLHDDANTQQGSKDNLAGRFAMKYRRDPEGFLEFIHDSAFAIDKSYKESWDFIMDTENSLKRHSNLNVFLSAGAKNVPRPYLDRRTCDESTEELTLLPTSEDDVVAE